MTLPEGLLAIAGVTALPPLIGVPPAPLLLLLLLLPPHPAATAATHARLNPASASFVLTFLLLIDPPTTGMCVIPVSRGAHAYLHEIFINGWPRLDRGSRRLVAGRSSAIEGN
ncbi:MAG TPA: hypothetical protein VNB91_03035 [Jatrophihabitantaceae bacterium]|nr:hypothetical protein [Jatrophihabitantaceae bacterium]